LSSPHPKARKINLFAYSFPEKFYCGFIQNQLLISAGTNRRGAHNPGRVFNFC